MKIVFQAAPAEVARIGIVSAEFFLMALVATSSLLEWGDSEDLARRVLDFSDRAEAFFIALGGVEIDG